MGTNKIVIFQTVKTCLISLDLDANERPFHREQLLHIIRTVLAIVLQCLYLITDANTASEYMRSILIISIGTLVFIAYLSAIFETATISDFIEHYETIINGSELIFIGNSNALQLLYALLCVFYRVKISKVGSTL